MAETPKRKLEEVSEYSEANPKKKAGDEEDSYSPEPTVIQVKTKHKVVMSFPGCLRCNRSLWNPSLWMGCHAQRAESRASGLFQE